MTNLFMAIFVNFFQSSKARLVNFNQKNPQNIAKKFQKMKTNPCSVFAFSSKLFTSTRNPGFENLFRHYLEHVNIFFFAFHIKRLIKTKNYHFITNFQYKVLLEFKEIDGRKNKQVNSPDHNKSFPIKNTLFFVSTIFLLRQQN